MTAEVKVATANRPQRMGDAANVRVVQTLANRGNAVIACQEVPDSDAAKITPHGYGRHRPGVAKSEVIYWEREVWEVLGRGAFKISSDKAPAPRYIVWVLLRHRATGHVVRIGCVHMVAFKTSRWGKEYRHQAAMVAEWLGRHGHRVLLGDYNGSFEGHWLDPVAEVARDHTPTTHSGPEGQNIDLIVVNKPHPRAHHARVVNDGDGDHQPVEARLPLAA